MFNTMLHVYNYENGGDPRAHMVSNKNPFMSQCFSAAWLLGNIQLQIE